MDSQSGGKGLSFYVVGVSYKNADAIIRGNFSINTDTRDVILEHAYKKQGEGMLVISTCNRTELYGFAQHPYQLIKILCTHTKGSVEVFEEVGYVYKNMNAVDHLFRVGTGLDSQILGDFEIISQLKNSFKASKRYNLINPYFERLINAVFQASKRIKNETEISSGATSVSFASVQYILKTVKHISQKNILLFGTGKIGRNTCENLVKHIENKHITLINRTKGKAEKIAGKFDLHVKEYNDLQSEINKSDILIVATGASQPTVTKELLQNKTDLLILDLSIPQNVSPDVADLKNVNVVHLDHLTTITDNTLARRKAHIPKSEEIINEVKSDFISWIETRKFAPTISALKQKLLKLKEAEINSQRKKHKDFNEEQVDIISSRIIQKITNHFANHLRDESTVTDESIALIEKVFRLST